MLYKEDLIIPILQIRKLKHGCLGRNEGTALLLLCLYSSKVLVSRRGYPLPQLLQGVYMGMCITERLTLSNF